MARLIIVEDAQELASLIASAARSRGHVVRAVHSGRSALAALATGRFDVAVVDLFLPDMNGGELLDHLRAANVPSIAMSGVFKGDPFAEMATGVHGARAFFEKPFDMVALLEAVEGVVGASGPRQDEGADPLAELQELEVVAEPADEWERIWRKKTEAAPRRRQLPTWAGSGDLAKTNVPRLLTAYFQARHSGELVLRHDKVAKVVYVESGYPVYAASNLAGERFARFCARRGLLSQDDLDAVAALAREEGLRTGEAMVQLGLITAEQRRQLLEGQVKEILWSTFAWQTGEYAFSPRRPTRSDLVKLSVFPGTLILEGVFKIETLVSLREKMPKQRKLFPTADPPYDLHAFQLSGAQASLVAYADGSKTVDDLLTLTDLTEREALATLLAFERMGMLEERRDDGRSRISFGL